MRCLNFKSVHHFTLPVCLSDRKEAQPAGVADLRQPGSNCALPAKLVFPVIKMSFQGSHGG